MPRTSNKAKVNTINVMRGTVPTPAAAAAAPVATGAVQGPTLFDSMKQGFGFGVGSSIARNLFENKPQQEQQQPKVSSDKTREFKQCMERTFNNYETCEIYLPSAAAAE